MHHGTSLVFTILRLKWFPDTLPRKYLPQNTAIVRFPPPQSVTLLINAAEFSTNPLPLHQSESIRTSQTSTTFSAGPDYFGGFPGPQQILSRLIYRFFPGAHRQLRRTVTIPHTTTITSIRGSNQRARAVPYISFDAVVRHNSVFESLTDEQLEELGGVEFRALNALLWIVGIVRKRYLIDQYTHASLMQYHVSVQLFAFTIIAPYMSMDKWKDDFRPPQQHRPVIPAW